MDPFSKYDQNALSQIRDNALILSLGNAYVCDDPILMKIGQDIYDNIDPLREDISTLKRRFPGKFTHEVDTDAIVGQIHFMAQMLMTPDKVLSEKCKSGELGRDLEASIKSLRQALKVIHDQVEGVGITYRKGESLSGLFSYLKDTSLLFGNAVAFVLKTILCLVVIALVPLIYLYVTMETVDNLTEKIDRVEAVIQSDRETLSQLNAQRARVLRKLDKWPVQVGTRQETIKRLELEMEIHKIDEKRQEVEFRVKLKERAIMETMKELESMKNKSLLERILRL
jgi:hypothetical protein